MKFIINLTDEILLINDRSVGEGAEMLVAKEGILDWPEIKDLLAQEKIKIDLRE